MEKQIQNQIPSFSVYMVPQFQAGKEVVTKAKREAEFVQMFLREAKSEYEFAAAARQLACKDGADNAEKGLLSIAAWHYKMSAEQFRLASEMLDATRDVDLSEKNRKYIELKKHEFEVLSKAMARKSNRASFVN